MKLPFNVKTSSNSINVQISFIYKIILPSVLLFTLILFVLGFRMNTNNEKWVNYVNYPFGKVETGSDCPLNFYNRPEYRLPYRWPLGFKTSYPIKHITPLS